MRVGSKLVCVVLALAFGAAPALAQAWRALPGARALARPGAPRVTLEVRASGGYACGGGGCNGGVEVRNVRGQLPSDQLTYFYSDRADQPPGCPTSGRESFFAEWTEVEIAPARPERIACGIGALVGDDLEEWVILRVRPARAAP